MENQRYNKQKSFSACILIVIFLWLTGCSQEQQSGKLTLADYPEHESQEAKLYISKCSGCHAAPLPGIHTTRQWSGVVQRMQMRMKNKAIQPLNSSELPLILGYLEKHARK